MTTENLSTLKIHKLTQEQYDRALATGNINKNELYLTPKKDTDMTNCVKFTDLAHQNNDKAGIVKIYHDVIGGGLMVDEDGYLTFTKADRYDIETGAGNMAITTRNFDEALNIVGNRYFATKEQIGDIETALDSILELSQEEINQAFERYFNSNVRIQGLTPAEMKAQE